MTAASAPGKIILFGEHAVVYGQPALAIPVTQVQAHVEVTDALRAGIQIEAPDISLQAELHTLAPGDPVRSVIENVFRSLGLSTPPYLNIRITSTIPVAAGLGSGAAVSVAIIRALSAHFGNTLTNEQVNALAYEVEKLHHGTPSGIDNTVITYACPVYFVKNPTEKRRAGDKVVETFRAGAPFTIVIGDTGIPAPTKESVGDVRKAWEADKRRWEKVFAKVGAIAQQARKAIETGEIRRLGPLMDENHALLQTLSVSSPELDKLVLMARAAGAEGAKLSGGGRGGNMIALVRPERAEQVASALLAAGAKRTLVTVVQP
jgi:mevalonate kinase